MFTSPQDCLSKVEAQLHWIPGLVALPDLDQREVVEAADILETRWSPRSTIQYTRSIAISERR
jgi:hypothetical protein